MLRALQGMGDEECLQLWLDTRSTTAASQRNPHGIQIRTVCSKHRVKSGLFVFHVTSQSYNVSNNAKNIIRLMTDSIKTSEYRESQLTQNFEPQNWSIVLLATEHGKNLHAAWHATYSLFTEILCFVLKSGAADE
jgi:hypothetical protein